MRLTCPSCEAVYEVPDGAIPRGGREVQCTNCGHGWYEDGPGAELDAGEQGDELGATEAASRPPVDPRVRRVLREEAQREVEARGRDRRGAPPPPEDVEDASARRQSRAAPRGDDLAGVGDVGLAPARSAPAPTAARRDRRTRGRSRGRGFLLGLAASLGVAALLALAYVQAPQIGGRLPQLAEPLDDYVTAVDGGRVALDAVARDVTERVVELLPEAGG